MRHGKGPTSRNKAVRLLVDGPDLPEPAGQGKGDLAGAAGQVEQPAPAGRTGPLREVIDQAPRVRHPEPVVIAGGTPVQVPPELQVGHCYPRCCQTAADSWSIVSMPYCSVGFPVLSTAMR